MKIRPLGDRLLVRVDESNKVSKGGIHLPDNAREKPRRGEVLAVGPGKLDADGKRTPLTLQVGDVVLYQQWSGSEPPKELGEGLLILSEADVLGVLEG